jgi:hypothetical protein
LRGMRAEIGDFKADMEVQTAIIRRLDHSVQNLTGEVRALAGQQAGLFGSMTWVRRRRAGDRG